MRDIILDIRRYCLQSRSRIKTYVRACARKPESVVVVAVVRVVVVAICNPAVVGSVVPITTPFDAVGTRAHTDLRT